MSLKLIRHIHNIGQGAFYTERFYSDGNNIANIVYDCGCGCKLPIRAKKLIKKSFQKNDSITILFISHFDADHVNGISTLKDSVKEISYVILPELTKEEKIILAVSSVANGEDASVKSLILDPQSFFGENTKVIFVSKIEVNIDKAPEKKLEELGSQMQSGTPIRCNDFNWMYVPFNYPMPSNDIDKLKRIIEDEKIRIDDWDDLFQQNKIARLRNIFKQYVEDINTASLVLFSGWNKSANRKCFCSTKPFSNLIDYKSACLYTGDVDLKKRDIRNELRFIDSTYIKDIGMIQVPHHGSLKSYNQSVLFGINPDCNLFFLSCGSNNKYGHPSSLILGDMCSKSKTCVCVNELRDWSVKYVFVVKHCHIARIS